MSDRDSTLAVLDRMAHFSRRSESLIKESQALQEMSEEEFRHLHRLENLVKQLAKIAGEFAASVVAARSILKDLKKGKNPAISDAVVVLAGAVSGGERMVRLIRQEIKRLKGVSKKLQSAKDFPHEPED